MDLLGSAINPLGTRAGTALSDPPMGGGENDYVPLEGYLLTDGGDNFVDEAGNKITYYTG